MCREADYYYTSMNEWDVRARKPHVCCACKEQISAGDVYRRSVVISDDRHHPFNHYKHCLRCATMLDAIRDERPHDAIAWKLDCGEDWFDTIGELPDEIAKLAFLTPAEAQAQLAKPKEA